MNAQISLDFSLFLLIYLLVSLIFLSLFTSKIQISDVGDEREEILALIHEYCFEFEEVIGIEECSYSSEVIP